MDEYRIEEGEGTFVLRRVRPDHQGQDLLKPSPRSSRPPRQKRSSDEEEKRRKRKEEGRTIPRIEEPVEEKERRRRRKEWRRVHRKIEGQTYFISLLFDLRSQLLFWTLVPAMNSGNPSNFTFLPFLIFFIGLNFGL